MDTESAAIRLELPFPPSVNSIWRGGRGGRHYLSPKYKAWKEAAATAAISQAQGRRVAGLFEISVELVKPDRRKRDLDNVALKAVLDLLKEIKLTDDDSNCVGIRAAWSPAGPPLLVIVSPHEASQ